MRNPPVMPARTHPDAADLICACLDPIAAGRPAAFRLLSMRFLSCPPTRIQVMAARSLPPTAHHDDSGR